MRIEAVRLDDGEAQRLIAALNEELAARYPEEGANHFRLDADEVAPGRGAFLVARDDAGAVLGCGAVRLVPEIGPGVAEVKRMYTAPAARGQGVAGRVLAELERIAGGELGATRMLLETGVRQPEAIRVYERAGYARVAAYGEYVGSALSVCMSKSLAVRLVFRAFALNTRRDPWRETAFPLDGRSPSSLPFLTAGLPAAATFGRGTRLATSTTSASARRGATPKNGETRVQKLSVTPMRAVSGSWYAAARPQLRCLRAGSPVSLPSEVCRLRCLRSSSPPPTMGFTLSSV